MTRYLALAIIITMTACHLSTTPKKTTQPQPEPEPELGITLGPTYSNSYQRNYTWADSMVEFFIEHFNTSRFNEITHQELVKSNIESFQPVCLFLTDTAAYFVFAIADDSTTIYTPIDGVIYIDTLKRTLYIQEDGSKQLIKWDNRDYDLSDPSGTSPLGRAEKWIDTVMQDYIDHTTNEAIVKLRDHSALFLTWTYDDLIFTDTAALFDISIGYAPPEWEGGRFYYEAHFYVDTLTRQLYEKHNTTIKKSLSFHIPPVKYQKPTTLSATGDFDGDGKRDTVQSYLTPHTSIAPNTSFDDQLKHYANVSTYLLLSSHPKDTLFIGNGFGPFCLFSIGDTAIAYCQDFPDHSSINHVVVQYYRGNNWLELARVNIKESAFYTADASEKKIFTNIPGYIEKHNGKWEYNSYWSIDTTKRWHPLELNPPKHPKKK